MIGLMTNCQQFFGDICDEIRLFFVEKKIDNVDNTDRLGFFVRLFLEEGPKWHAWAQVIADGRILEVYSNSMDAVVGSPLEIKKYKKRFIKHTAYMLLKEYTGKKTPWGSLTGIRPTKLARELLFSMGPDAKEYFIHTFDVDKPKADLAFNIVERQLPVIAETQPQDIDIYIGIPFCTSRCSYCSFVSKVIGKCEALKDRYLDALFSEIRSGADIVYGKKIRCIYVGGGTPTALSADDLKKLFKEIHNVFHSCQEFTVEAGRPDTITAEKLSVIRDAGVDRICINAQTTNPETLTRIGRTYGAEAFGQAFELARTFGFHNINCDIILGLPGEQLTDVKRTLEDVDKFSPENVTVHTLAIKNAAQMTLESASQYGITQEIAQMVEFSRKYLEKKGYGPYYLYRQKYMAGNMENVGYSRPDKLCIYNIDNMEETVSVASFGAGSISKNILHSENRIERACNTRDIEQYIEKVDDMVARKAKLFGVIDTN